MDLYENFRAFQEVAKTGSFIRAASRLDVAPSVITKRISQLEARLGVKLFVRSTRSVKLTEIGGTYLEKSWEVLSEFEELLNLAKKTQGETIGFLRVKVPTSLNTFLLRKAFQDFHMTYPKIRLEIVLLDRSVNPVTEVLVSMRN
ncbi:LysR family transcriptional regulator [Agrobacterium larrymoorei]|uniref:LysR family transcriptional regulator n=1 Tax=Agrobacterium larrymoorei TaxID=160699 RepID=UPI001AEE3AD4|nr:LysR family transcriptional regulator [Agrobacterium larrymoorei]NTJ45386.1 LysR family transcriptional regulator [Agrobacterium larrymoorei]